MASLTPLHIAFTMDCQPARHRFAPEGPRSWEMSARAIDGFCSRLLQAGYLPTLFLSPQCAEMHGPLLEELAGCGVELGLYVQPQSLEGAEFKQHLGQYRGDEQRAVVGHAIRAYQRALGQRPRSVRSHMFSASDETYGVLYALGFQQGSLSSPGRRVAKHAALWTDAVQDAHYVHPKSRLQPGSLSFLELPVTTDAGQERGGVAPELAIEAGTLDKWHRPLIAAQLQRMQEEAVPFQALCFLARNSFDYHDAGERYAATLEGIIRHLAGLEERYELIPTTLAGAHARFRRQTIDDRQETESA